MKILTRFLMGRFFSGVGLVLLIVCGIIMAVTFVERLPSNPTAIATLADAWVRLIEYVPMFLPPAIFMGTLLASYNLTKSSEKIIVSSAGLSPYQSARPFLVGAAIIGIFAATVINPYSVNLSTRQVTENQFQLVDDAIWLRDAGADGFITMRAARVARAGAALEFGGADVFVQNNDFKLTHHVKADTLLLDEEGLHADAADVWHANGTMTKEAWNMETRLTPQTVLDRYLQPDQISFWRLPGFIDKMTQIGVPVRGHLVQFWTLLFLPLTLISMATLGVAFSQTRQRRNYSFGVKFGLGILTCFAVYFTVNMFNALGVTGVLPPLLATVAPPLIIIAGAGAFIASFDTI